MEIRQSYKKCRRGSYDSADPEAVAGAGMVKPLETVTGRRGSLALAAIPMPKSPDHTDLPDTKFFAKRVPDTLPMLKKTGSESMQHHQEPTSMKYLLPPGASATRRGSLPTFATDFPSPSEFAQLEDKATDDNFLPNIQQARKVRCFYQSQPGTPASVTGLSTQAATTKIAHGLAFDFGELAGKFLDPKQRRFSTSSGSGNEESVGQPSILSIISKSVAGTENQPHQCLAKQVFQVLINPIPKAPSSNSISSDKDEDLYDRPEYVSLPLGKEELHKRLRRHGEWIRKGENGFITGKNKL